MVPETVFTAVGVALLAIATVLAVAAGAWLLAAPLGGFGIGFLKR